MPLLFQGILMISCIEPLEWMENVTPSGALVVEGRITSEKGPHLVYLRRTQSVIAEGPGEGVVDASVSISDGENLFPLQGKGSGIYATDSLVQGIPGKTYELRIDWNNEVYTAQAELIPATPLDKVEIRPWSGDPDNPEGIQYFEFTYRSSFGVPRPYSYSIDVQISENVANYYPATWQVPSWLERVLNTPGHSLTDTVYYLHPGLEPPALLAYGESILAGLPFGTTVTEKFYSISADHYNFIRALSAETDWRGLGPFGYIPANVPTNISNGAFGWFSASDVVVVKQKLE